MGPTDLMREEYGSHRSRYTCNELGNQKGICSGRRSIMASMLFHATKSVEHSK